MRIVVASILAAFVVGCGNNDDAIQEPRVPPDNTIIVPPMPDEAANNATLGGVDTDVNGIRDDIDRVIAERFGHLPETYQKVLQLQRSLQSMVTSPSDEHVAAYQQAVGCTDTALLTSMGVVTRNVLNTVERRNMYADALGRARASLSVACTESFDNQSESSQEVVYINGADVTLEEAMYDARTMAAVLEESIHHQGSAQRPFTVGVWYNPIGSYETMTTAFTPVVGASTLPTFWLKTAEELSNIPQVALAYDSDSETVATHESQETFDALLSVMQTYRTCPLSGTQPFDAGLLDCGASNPIDGVVSGLSEYLMGKIDRTVLVVTHGEGNLIAQVAYANHMVFAGITAAHRHVRLVQVGNVSRVSMHHLSLTHGRDCIVFRCVGLQGVQSLPERLQMYRTTPLCPGFICDFGVVQATVALVSNGDPADDYLHDFAGVYLSDLTVDVLDTQGVPYTPGATRFRDRFEDLVYSAVYSMEIPSP